MEWQVILVLVIAIPLILFPAAYLWYINMGGIYAAVQGARKRKAAREEGIRAVAEEHPAGEELVGTRR